MTVLSARSLTKRFGGVVAVSDVDLDVESATVHALIGPNGAGKTTVFNCLSGHAEPTTGVVTLDGNQLTGSPPYRMAEKGLARTFQNLELFGQMSVLENVMVGRHLRSSAGLVSSMLRLPRHFSDERASRAAALDSLRRVGIADLADIEASALPYGRQRLVEVARALASEPVVLLLDEPVAGLTSGEAAEVAGLIRQLAADGMAVLIVEHDMRTIMGAADVITVLDAGVRIAHGAPEEVRRDPAVIEAYLGTGSSGAATTTAGPATAPATGTGSDGVGAVSMGADGRRPA